MKKMILACMMAGALAVGAYAAEDGKQPEATSGNSTEEHHHFEVKGGKQVEPDKDNLEKNKDVVTVYNTYWKAIVDKDYKKSYSLEDSNFKKKMTYKEYVDRFKDAAKHPDKAVTIKFVEPIEVKYINEREVVVRGFLRYKTSVMDSIKTFEDRWAKSGNSFVHLQQEETKEVVK